ncbi:MAG: hypothetical protein AAGA60_00075 [Cyanobacteria bacterium P01_E01_bin.42]
MNTQKSAAMCNPPLCNGVAKVNKSQAAMCNPPFCNGASDYTQRPWVELVLIDPLTMLALA